MTGQPRRIQLRRTKGWRKPAGAVIVDRRTKYGNPISWRTYYDTPRFHDDGERYQPGKDTCRRWAVTDFRHDVLANPTAYGYPTVKEIRAELAGKDLCCWCPPGEPCHVDVLLDVANAAPNTGLNRSFTDRGVKRILYECCHWKVRAMTRDEALAVLAARAGIDPPAEDEPVGPAVEPILRALRDGEDITDRELDAALALMLPYVNEVQRAIVGAARRVPDGAQDSRMTLYEVGAAIGWPHSTASMRAMNFARKLGLAPPAGPRVRTDKAS